MPRTLAKNLYQVDTPWGCFGIEVTNGKVTDTAPISRWAYGHNWITVSNWYKAKGAKVRKTNWRWR